MTAPEPEREPSPAARGGQVEHPANELLPAVLARTDEQAVVLGDRALTYRELGNAATALAVQLEGLSRVAVWADTSLETCTAVVAGVLAGVPVVPINPKAGQQELQHIIADSRPSALVASPGAQIAPSLSGIARIGVDLCASTAGSTDTPPGQSAAFIIYTSGTTGPPKGVVLSRSAIASNLDALAIAWEWTDVDVVAHALPLFHVHGLILGVLGPLRRGGTAQLLGRFASAAVADALAGPASMLFAVPTMYHRLAQDAVRDLSIASALARARLLVSGSAPLSPADFDAVARASGQRITERYGMTETLIICSTRVDGDRRPGTVGGPLDGVELRVLDDRDLPIEACGEQHVGELVLRSPSLFSAYLNLPEQTRAALHDGWFRTGDMGWQAADGSFQLVGRRNGDLINSGGYRIGAGEVEAVLLTHPDVSEVAVTAEPDEDLGERVAAWVVLAGPRRPSPDELADHVSRALSPHKRPRSVHYVGDLPRNPMGKVLKRLLKTTPTPAGGTSGHEHR